jgi:hypothetical protein
MQTSSSAPVASIDYSNSFGDEADEGAIATVASKPKACNPSEIEVGTFEVNAGGIEVAHMYRNEPFTVIVP